MQDAKQQNPDQPEQKAAATGDQGGEGGGTSGSQESTADPNPLAEARAPGAPGKSGSDEPVVESGPDALDKLTDSIADAESWLPEPLQPAWVLVTDYPIIGALLIALFGFLVAKVVVWLLRKGSGHLTRRTSTDFDDQLIQHLSRPIFVTIFYGFLALATVSLKLNDSLTSALIRILATLGLLVWMNGILPVSALVIDALASLRDRYAFIQERTVPLFAIVSKVLVVGLFAYLLLLVWRIDATAWLASAGVIGIAVGFAAKDTLANLFSGVFIVADAPYKIGDFINLDSGERGMVTHVGLRSTRLLTRDDIEITIPNAVIANAKIINEAGGRWEKCRLRVKVGVAYGSDVDQVCEVLNAVGSEHKEVCSQPEARVRMRGFGDSSLDFELLCWIDKPVDRGRITHELLMAVYKRLNEESIEIPFPQRDLYIRQMPESGAAGGES